MSIRLTAQQIRAQQERERIGRETLRDIAALSARQFKDSIQRLLDIPDAEWQAAVDAEAEQARIDAQFGLVTVESDIEEAQPWQSLVKNLSPVGKLAHASAMLGDTQEQQRAAELTV